MNPTISLQNFFIRMDQRKQTLYTHDEEENTMNEMLNHELLETVSGGNLTEAREYLEQMCKKYGVDDLLEVRDYMTPEEKQRFWELFFHRP